MVVGLDMLDHIDRLGQQDRMEIDLEQEIAEFFEFASQVFRNQQPNCCMLL